VTYPDLYVATLLNEYFVPVQVNIDKARELVIKYHPIWTPNLNLLDEEGAMVYHVEGWLPPPEYSAMLFLSRGHYLNHKKRYSEAAPNFQEVLLRFPQSHYAPQALYYLGVSNYLASHKAEALKEAWGRLQRNYPYSSWAIRAGVL
jgi:thioredoxin-related protein